MKQPISVFDKAGDICKAMKQGILLTSGTVENPNTMTIGWGMIGVEWGKHIFLALVRESRFTRELVDKGGDFTVNIPWGQVDPKILGYCGTKSGRDVNKFAEMGLTAVEASKISAPGIAQLPLTLECKVLHRQLQELDREVDASVAKYYPENAEGKRDLHYMYFAEILDAYIIE